MVKVGVRYSLIAIGTALACVLVVWWYVTHAPVASIDATATVPVKATATATSTVIAWWLALAAYLWFAAAGVALTVIDFERQRLPDTIVLPSLVAVVVLLSAAAIVVSDWSRLWATLGAAAALFALYMALALVYPKGMGGGDVKLAPVVGAALGFIGWDVVVVGTFAGFLGAALAGVAVMLLGQAQRRSAIAFGPWMLVGAWIGIVWGPVLAT